MENEYKKSQENVFEFKGNMTEKEIEQRFSDMQKDMQELAGRISRGD